MCGNVDGDEDVEYRCGYGCGMKMLMCGNVDVDGNAEYRCNVGCGCGCVWEFEI